MTPERLHERPPLTCPLYLLSIEAGLRLDSADGGRGSRRSPSPPAQGAPSQEHSQEEGSPGVQHGSGSHQTARPEAGCPSRGSESTVRCHPEAWPRKSASVHLRTNRAPCPSPHPQQESTPASSTLHFLRGLWRHLLPKESWLTSGSLSTTPNPGPQPRRASGSARSRTRAVGERRSQPRALAPEQGRRPSRPPGALFRESSVCAGAATAEAGCQALDTPRLSMLQGSRRQPGGLHHRDAAAGAAGRKRVGRPRPGAAPGAAQPGRGGRGECARPRGASSSAPGPRLPRPKERRKSAASGPRLPGPPSPLSPAPRPRSRPLPTNASQRLRRRGDPGRAKAPPPVAPRKEGGRGCWQPTPRPQLAGQWPRWPADRLPGLPSTTRHRPRAGWCPWRRLGQVGWSGSSELFGRTSVPS